MKKDIEKRLESYVQSLELNSFEERPTSYHQVHPTWLRVIRTWTHHEEMPEFLIEDREGTYEDREDSELVSYTPIRWAQLEAMNQALKMECPHCESEDPNM